MIDQVLLQLMQQAPGIGALIIAIVLFLGHIKTSDEANRTATRELRDAIKELAQEMREDRRA